VSSNRIVTYGAACSVCDEQNAGKRLGRWQAPRAPKICCACDEPEEPAMSLDGTPLGSEAERSTRRF
jgi:hypothetical protein